MKTQELIVLGAGPAGITAAVYAVRKQIDLLVITQDIGGQAALSGDVENYTGYQFITGPELAHKFQEHMESFGINVLMPQKVVAVGRRDKLLTVTTDKGQHLTKSLIIATGKRSRELKVVGEKEYKNKGLTYCAICDGPLFKGKNVAIIGGGNSGLDAAMQMMKISPKVYVIDREKSVKGDAIMFAKLKTAGNVEFISDAIVKKVYGDNFVRGIEIEQTSRPRQLAVEGVFVEIGLIPNSEYAGVLKRNECGEIVVDCHNRTNVEGVFAAGDVTNVPEKQIIIACGEGSKASLSAFKYLASLPL